MKHHRHNVVIVEDDSVFRRGLVRLFENEDCRVNDFSDARTALEFIQTDKPDFVVCDYKLPGMNGLELLDELRKENVGSPFVLVTAHFSEELMSEALAHGATAAISKPLNINGLRDIYEDAIGRR